MLDFRYWGKFIPSIGVDIQTNRLVLKDTKCTTDPTDSVAKSDIVEKQYIESLARVALNGGVKGEVSGLETDVNIPQVTCRIDQNNDPKHVNKYVQLTGINAPANKLAVSYTELTADTVSPSATSDMEDKLYVDSKFSSKADYDIAYGLPGDLVADGLAVIFIPTLSSCDDDVEDLVSKTTDPLPGIKLNQTDNNLKPDFRKDWNDIVCIGFNTKDKL